MPSWNAPRCFAPLTVVAMSIGLAALAGCGPGDKATGPPQPTSLPEGWVLEVSRPDGDRNVMDWASSVQTHVDVNHTITTVTLIAARGSEQTAIYLTFHNDADTSVALTPNNDLLPEIETDECVLVFGEMNSGPINWGLGEDTGTLELVVNDDQRVAGRFDLATAVGQRDDTVFSPRRLVGSFNLSIE
ncbi:MAG: hypothetical protein KDA27_17265 [Candidatus Eisenbacteria bacterium]|uniref:DUF4352 domain-containing protein n=1 Tax=Eiseniibacteriota bacterium TaxID=2212470 RepID=A0A956NED7_UNCEI|nr:hypothetical protein [Candidatus Eisenbacteria bacterium]MCB9466551.1 hypothetical protein [Candidatus Eisenbacteria bacterium]